LIKTANSAARKVTSKISAWEKTTLRNTAQEVDEEPAKYDMV
jgi:hypothetical protein